MSNIIDELDRHEYQGRSWYVRMPPRRSYPVVIVTPERIVALEAEVKRLREALKVYADLDNWSVYRSDRGRRVRCWLGALDAWDVARAALERTA